MGLRDKISNTSGFTLSEILVTLAITAITALAASTIIIWLTNLSNFVVQRDHAQESLILAAHRLKSTLALAVNVGNNGVPANSMCDVSTPSLQAGGCFVRVYNIPTSATQPIANPFLLTAANLDGTVDTLARFYREAGVNTGNMMETGIFFRRPDITAQFDDGAWPSGTLYISTVTAGSPIGIGPQSIVFDNFSNITIQLTTVADVVGATPVQRAKSAAITLTTRYFSSGTVKDWIFCPAGLCTPTAAYKDETITVTANFINNVIHIGTPANGDPHILNTIFGNLYFFQTRMPADQ